MQAKETFTVKELADLFGISRQAMSKHVNKLDSNLLAKNERGYKVILHSGVLQLASNLGNKELLDMLQPNNKKEAINTDKKEILEVASKLHIQLSKENEFLQEQLREKDHQIKQMQKIIDQQQQLTLQANRQIEQLQEQLSLTSENQENEKNSAVKPISDKVEHVSEIKWWQLWKK